MEIRQKQYFNLYIKLALQCHIRARFVSFQEHKLCTFVHQLFKQLSRRIVFFRVEECILQAVSLIFFLLLGTYTQMRWTMEVHRYVMEVQSWIMEVQNTFGKIGMLTRKIRFYHAQHPHLSCPTYGSSAHITHRLQEQIL